MRDLKRDLEICNAASTPPWKVAFGVDEATENWIIASLGYSNIEDADIYVTTDHVHASEFSGDAYVDAVFFIEARTGWPYAIQRALAAEAEAEMLGKYVNYLRKKLDRFMVVYEPDFEKWSRQYRALEKALEENEQLRKVIEQKGGPHDVQMD